MIGFGDTDQESVHVHCLVVPVSGKRILGDDNSICYLAEPVSTASKPAPGLNTLRCINTALRSKGA